MKKVIMAAAIPLVLAVAWAGTNAYVGQQVQPALQQALEQGNRLLEGDGIQQELVSFEKGWLGSRAVTRINLEGPAWEGGADTLQLVHDIRHGPVFLGGDSPVSFGLARMTTHLDEESLSAEQRQWLEKTFAGKSPFTGQTVMHTDGSYDYSFTLNPLEMALSGETQGGAWRLEGATLQGNTDSSALGHANLHVSGFKIGATDLQFAAPTIDMNMETAELLGSRPLGKLDIQIPGVSITLPDTQQPVGFDLSIHSASQQADQDVAGTLAVNIDKFQGTGGALDKLHYQVDFQGLNTAGLTELGQLQADMQNAAAQVEWNNEALETPDGQARQQVLHDKINQTLERMSSVLFGKVLQDNRSRIQANLNAAGSQGKADVGLELTYTNRDAPDMATLASFGAKDWGKLFKGTLTVDADKALLPEGVADLLLAPYVQGGLLRDEGSKVHSQTLFEGESVTVNGKQMPFTDWLGLLAPAMSSSAGDAGLSEAERTAAELGIPGDLMEKIQQEGLSPEVMQMLEESDDVPRETLEMLRQLQQIQDDAQEGKMPEQDGDGAAPEAK